MGQKTNDEFSIDKALSGGGQPKMKFKFSFEDHDEVVENDTYAGALNYVINGDVSILGWIKNTYKKVGDKWVMIYGPRLFNKTKEKNNGF